MRDDISRWRESPCPWVGRINTVKMTVLPNATYGFNPIPTKLPMAFFTELEQKISQFVWKHKRPQIAKAVLRKKMELEESSFLTSGYTTKLLSRQYGTGTKTNTDQWNNTDSPEMNLCTCGDLSFDTGGNNIQWGKDSLFSKWCWENWTAACERKKLEHFLTPCTKIKWIKDLNVGPETLKLLEENIGRPLDDINQSKILYDPPPRVTEIKVTSGT